MPVARNVLMLRLLTGLGLLLGSLIICAEVFAPSVVMRIQAVEARHDDGLAYTVPLGKHSRILFELRSDGPDSADASELILFENGKSLGPAHSSHAEIRRQGTGRFSHWNTALWFSSSDATDPRTNGRDYLVEARFSVKPAWQIIGLVAFVAALLPLLAVLVKRIRTGPWSSRADEIARFISALEEPQQYTRVCVPSMVLFVAGAAGAAAVLYGWHFGGTSTTGLAVARYLPISDAMGYHSCATSIAAAGKFDEGHLSVWCSRRALYPAMLASLFALTAWSSQLALLMQGALVGLAIASFSLVVGTLTGRVSALVAAVLLSVYAWEFVLGLFMTEVLGFTLGLCGLALLLAFCRTKHLLHLLAGTAFVSVGLAARAGALFALPALIVWAPLAFSDSNWQRRARFLFVAAAGAVFGPLLQYAVVSLLGADPSNTGGNFSTSLYGLSTGSRDWSQAHRDFAPLFKIGESEAFREIFTAAWENIKSKPGVFIGALAEAGRAYLYSLFTFGALDSIGTKLTALAALGLARCLFELRRPASRLLIALAIAEVLTAPLIMDSGGTRVFAVTAPVRILLCALGVQWILKGVLALIARPAEHAVTVLRPGLPATFAACLGMLMMVLIIAPITPFIAMSHLESVAGRGCPIGLTEVVARIGRESQSLTIIKADAAVESVDPFKISPQRFADDPRIKTTWYGRDFMSLSAPITVIRAVDLSRTSVAAIRALVFVGDLPPRDDPVSLCVDDGAFVELAGAQHHVIKEVRSLGAR